MQSITLQEPHRSDPVNRRKQLQGFPPNFIHSLDASHMILSALKCDEKGLSFAAVHDSFWTHASNIETMNDILRDSFIRIHTEDVIGRLAAEFDARYMGCLYLAKIRSGTVLHKKVTTLRRANNKSQSGKKDRLLELVDERDRLRLLASSDAKEVAQGKKMVTPGSLFEEFGEQELAPDEDLKEFGIGSMETSETGLHPEGVHTSAPEINNSLPIESGSAFPDTASRAKKSHPSYAGTGNIFEQALNKSQRISSGDLWIWLPLKFPPVPKKVGLSHYRHQLVSRLILTRVILTYRN
jgi:DNA-directed RNA polymerase